MSESKKKLKSSKKVILIICAVVIILAVIAAVVIVIIKSSLIGKNKAEQIALYDAGLKRSEVSALRTELDFDDGYFQYEVEFYYDSIEYDYNIMAKDGDIISRDIDNDKMNSFLQNSESGLDNNSSILNNEKIDSDTNINQSFSQQKNEISFDDAKTIALEDAKLRESDVTFVKVQLERDDLINVYDVEFYFSDAEYDYEINAENGTIKEKNIKNFQNLSDSGKSDQYIGIEKAKEIAVGHAGFSNNEVQFSKTELDIVHNIAEYEIKFYKGRTEYEYSIDAVTGNILEYDSD